MRGGQEDSEGRGVVQGPEDAKSRCLKSVAVNPRMMAKAERGVSPVNQAQEASSSHGSAEIQEREKKGCYPQNACCPPVVF